MSTRYRTIYGYDLATPHKIMAMVIDGNTINDLEKIKIIASDDCIILTSKPCTFVEEGVIDADKEQLFEKLVDADTLKALFQDASKAMRQADNWRRASEKSRRK